MYLLPRSIYSEYYLLGGGKESYGSPQIIASAVFRSERYHWAIERLFDDSEFELSLTAVAEFLRCAASIPEWTDDGLDRMKCFASHLLSARGVLPFVTDLCVACMATIARTAGR